jgi:hypothetical protein
MACRRPTACANWRAIAGRAGLLQLRRCAAAPAAAEIAFRQAFQERLGIDQDITLLAGSGRGAALDADPSSFAGLAGWPILRACRQGPALPAFADEPNLNYRLCQLRRLLRPAMLRRVRQPRRPRRRRAHRHAGQLAPADGPFRNGAAQRRGLDWARQLLAEHGNDIDALAWHEWMLRDLLATRRYRDSVRQAADLVGLDLNGRPRKALLLDQTNISSGDALGPYQQNSQFAALWWAWWCSTRPRTDCSTCSSGSRPWTKTPTPRACSAKTPPAPRSSRWAWPQRFILQHWLARCRGSTTRPSRSTPGPARR